MNATARIWAIGAAGLVWAFGPNPSGDWARVFAPWNSPTSPGCAIGVQQGSQTTFAAFGSADLEHHVPNSPATIFEAGSVSKQFTSAAILLLAQDGKLGLDDDIRKYLPEMPDYGAKITINHLLSHTSGLRDWGVLAALEGWPRTTRAMNQADVLALVARQTKLNYLPGDEYSYTNTGYNLLTIIVERVSGQSFPDFTRDRLFQPLGMASTSWRDDFRKVVENRSIAYVKRGAVYQTEMPFENAIGNGGLLTTVKDLLIWNDALNKNRLGSFVVQNMERQAILNSGRQIKYARGLRGTNRNGFAEISHDGATAGYRTWLARFPSQGLSIAILCNAGDVGRSAAVLGYKVADPLLPQIASPPPGTEAHMPARAGLFVSERTGWPLVLVSDHGVLRKETGEALQFEGPHLVKADDGLLRFDGNDKFVLEDNDGNVEPFHRTTPATGAPAALSAYAGAYGSGEIDTIYAVEEQAGRLTMQNRRRPSVTMPLYPAYRDAFLFDTDSGPRTGLARFRRDAGGLVTALDIGVTRRVRALRFTLLSSGAHTKAGREPERTRAPDVDDGN